MTLSRGKILENLNRKKLRTKKADNIWGKAKKRTYSMTHSSCCNPLLMGSMFVYLHMDKLVPEKPLL